MTLKPKECAYDAEISPLMSKIIALCKQHKINMAAQFALDVGGDNDDHKDHVLYCTTVLDVDQEDTEGIERIAAIRRVMYPPRRDFFAFTIVGEHHE